MMKVLWVCNIILPEFSKEFNIKKVHTAGWISGMLNELKDERNINLGFAFPVIDNERYHDGIKKSHSYYSFHASMDNGKYNSTYKDEFIRIINHFKPDIIHIWGTEYRHSRLAIEAAKDLGISKHVLVHIQGLVSVCAEHYMDGIINELLDFSQNINNYIRDEKQQFTDQSVDEIVTIQEVKNILGRTDWDKNCTYIINPTCKYYKCEELLRESIYNNIGKWKLSNCQKHRIFISQATYPVKGFHYVIQALPFIISRFPNVEVYVSGHNIMDRIDKNGNKSQYTKYLEKLIGEYCVGDYIHFTGLLNESEMALQYLTAHVFVTPSTIENSSNSICEAMLIGTPTVSSYVGGTPSLVIDGENGLLYPAGDFHMLAAKIISIFENDDMTCRISKKSVIAGQKRNDRAKVKQRLIQIYEKLYNE